MSGATNASRHLSGFEDTVKDFWASRPRRPHRGRKLAGVAAGVGYRYGIDPVVVRVALVVLTIFGGIGITLYVLGWLFLPGEDDEVSAFESLIGRGRSSVSKPLAVLLCLLLFPVSGWAFAGSDWFDGGGFIGLALVITAVYLLHRSRGHLNRPVPVRAAQHDRASATGSVTMPVTTVSGEQRMPPDWDPLGAAPLAWDLPDPAPAPEPPAPAPPPRPKSKIGVAAFGVALAVGGVGAALAASGTPWFTWAHVIGLVLGVLGVGLVAGSFLGGGRGLIWLAALLSVAGIALTTVRFDQFGGGFGDLTERPRTAADVRPLYERTAGNVQLDLRAIEDTPAPVTTTVRAGAGEISVLVPRDADVTYTCQTTAGDVDCLGRKQSGAGLDPLTGTHLGSDGEGGPRFDLTVESAAGTLEVTRG
ncbi:PspC domain-containing protein [Prauserella muralis]|uniref:PspC family transcriptional regulator n=1 Tax=Prauserella muralis TaxID=588067 RepID=A0A2V4BDX5_9PSEU|nr:PspC domain-containing protein [Prauserella muralis]PXY32259.1 PspC family transcriptional regulator [Prauserella muralis]TWE24073.1 phage shock protein C (PspC) family protein [Prauserella muralis]